MNEQKSLPETIDEVLIYAKRFLIRHEIQTPDLDARVLLAFLLRVDKPYLISHKKDRLSKETLIQYETLLNRRIDLEPVAHIRGIKEFMSLNFNVKRGVFIPRPETETLVESALGILGDKKKVKIGLDICTGSANIPISICHYHKYIKFYATENSETAIIQAKENIAGFGLENRIKLIREDVFSTSLLPKLPFFDIITSNPPYLTESELNKINSRLFKYEGEELISGGRNGTDFYLKIVDVAKDLMKKNGRVLVEIGPQIAEKVREIFKNSDYFENIETISDLNGRERTIIAKKR